jgi:hypothetical protein
VLFIATHNQITTETAGCAVIPTAMYVQAMNVRQQDEQFRAKFVNLNFHSCTVHLDTIKVFYLPTDAQ